MSKVDRHNPQTGRGAASNPAGRFEGTATVPADDGWGSLDEPLPELVTEVRPEPARSIISRNQSPDIPFEQSINPYRGCEHGCIYCYARPSHAYVNLSPGIDFETKLFYKADAGRLLTEELGKPSYRCTPITLGANTDPYQPIERRYRVTREILEVLDRCRHPVTIITKGTLIDRDLDLLQSLAADNLVRVLVSLPTLSEKLKRTLEPRAASPAARLRIIGRLADAGVPVGVMVAPVIPALTDHELEGILERAASAGASYANYVVLRLPYEVKDLFREWLRVHEPLKADHVMSRVAAMRGGRDNDPRFSSRMSGEGVYADLLRQRFTIARTRLKLDSRQRAPLPTGLFKPPVRAAKTDQPQMRLEF